ncbi:flagellar hook-length control protein FliK [Rhodopirellula sp. MGV]|uniref:flagellar hook-length control protein FliK n=1 Tax=Rhodopirellula sp. MGV TaxID=2023130 RepID=UPI000B96D093|nr:flagellar hook-length control protein FliK [Rhodopirellula sp. MGV]OYP32352.1 hypothetical protein CGZ80_20005 [Rhodopirellula sp. MGV]PNY35863.1 hypothetical protein C2E31_15470 [Rhodopirellula baltica]
MPNPFNLLLNLSAGAGYSTGKSADGTDQLSGLPDGATESFESIFAQASAEVTSAAISSQELLASASVDVESLQQLVNSAGSSEFPSKPGAKAILDSENVASTTELQIDASMNEDGMLSVAELVVANVPHSAPSNGADVSTPVFFANQITTASVAEVATGTPQDVMSSSAEGELTNAVGQTVNESGVSNEFALAGMEEPEEPTATLDDLKPLSMNSNKSGETPTDSGTETPEATTIPSAESSNPRATTADIATKVETSQQGRSDAGSARASSDATPPTSANLDDRSLPEASTIEATPNQNPEEGVVQQTVGTSVTSSPTNPDDFQSSLVADSIAAETHHEELSSSAAKDAAQNDEAVSEAIAKSVVDSNAATKESIDLATDDAANSNVQTISAAAANEEADKYKRNFEEAIEENSQASQKGDHAARDAAKAELTAQDEPTDNGSFANSFAVQQWQPRVHQQPEAASYSFDFDVERSASELDSLASLNASGSTFATPDVPSEFDGVISLEDFLNGAPDAAAIGLVSESIGEAVESAITDDKSVYLEVNPKELGFLTIEVSHVDDAVHAKIVASEVVTSEILQHHRSQLVESLNQLGYESLDVNISYEQRSSNDSNPQQNQQRSSFQPTRSSTPTIPLTSYRSDRPSGLDIVA